MKKTIKLPVEYEHHYFQNEIESPKRIIVLLHGYLLDGEFMLKKLESSLPKDALIISPNGPFLVPQKKGEEYFDKYSWYFFDPIKKSFYINYEPAALFLKNLIEKLNPNNLPVTIIGYSQGGFLAPKVAEVTPNVDSVLGLACIFRNERFKIKENIKYSQIHGEADLVVPLDQALAEWDLMEQKHDFTILKDTGHRIDQDFLSSIVKFSKMI